MSMIQKFFTGVTIISVISGIVFLFVEKMLLHSIGFFISAIILIIMKRIWGDSIWLDKILKKSGDRI